MILCSYLPQICAPCTGVSVDWFNFSKKGRNSTDTSSTTIATIVTKTCTLFSMIYCTAKCKQRSPNVQTFVPPMPSFLASITLPCESNLLFSMSCLYREKEQQNHYMKKKLKRYQKVKITSQRTMSWCCSPLISVVSTLRRVQGMLGKVISNCKTESILPNTLIANYC